MAGKLDAEDRRQHERGGKDANAFGQRTHDEKQRCRDVARSRAEPAFEQRVGGQQSPRKYDGQEQRAMMKRPMM